MTNSLPLNLQNSGKLCISEKLWVINNSAIVRSFWYFICKNSFSKAAFERPINAQMLKSLRDHIAIINNVILVSNIEFRSRQWTKHQEKVYRQQPLPLLYSIDIWPARNSRLTQRETNHYITRCASELAWSYLAGRSPGQLVIYLFAQHQWFAVCCQ